MAEIHNTINLLKDKVSIMFITHALPKNLLVDEVVRIGSGTMSKVDTAQGETGVVVGGGAHG